MTPLPDRISGHRNFHIGAANAAGDAAAAVLAAALALALAAFLSVDAGAAAAIGVAYFGFTLATIRLTRRIQRDQAD